MNKEKEGFRQGAWELLRFAVIAVLIVVPVRVFIAQPFIVSGNSMVPTFENGEYLIIDEISYRLRAPERGEVIVFRYPQDPRKFFIKRIVGLPGEIVEIKDGKVIVKNPEQEEDFELNETYVKNRSFNNLKASLGTGEYFVMGDNRAASSDSRMWGALPEKFIVGRAFLRLWPLAHADFLPGDY